MTDTRLARRLGRADALVLGLGSMIGAGVFSAASPAAGAAGDALLVSLLLAAVVAACNALSTAQLAALHPVSGGSYAYGRARLGAWAGFVAGASFLSGKTASAIAMALTFGTAVWPERPGVPAAALAVALVAVNVAGVTKTAAATRIILVLVAIGLTAAIVGSWGGGDIDVERLAPSAFDPGGIARGAAFCFFAFAGYARIATLGEEVVEPERTIPWAIPRALGIAFVVYAVVFAGVLAALGATALAAEPSPLVAATEAGSLASLGPIVRLAAAVGSAGVLVAGLAGLGRTSFAMASEGDLPSVLGRVHPRTRTPWVAEIAVGVVVVAAVAVLDLRGAIGFSSAAVLTYYAVANASALRLGPDERRYPVWISALGLVLCLGLAVLLPVRSVLVWAALLAVWLVGRTLFVARSRP